MAEQQIITGGFGGHDPIGVYAYEVMERTLAPNSSVGERCPEVFRDASNLILRMSGTFELIKVDGTAELAIKTPRVTYKPTDHNLENELEASVWLELTQPLPDDDNIQIDLVGGQIALMASSPSAPDKRLLRLSNGGIERSSFGTMRPAGHSELNYMWGLISRIKDVTIPKDSQEQEIRRLDLDADRRAANK